MASFEELSEVSLAIIAAVGDARSSYIEAIQEAKAGHFEEARALIDAGAEEYLKGHHAHASLIQSEAAGSQTQMSLLLTHSEDQLMSAEAFGILADEFIELYERIARDEEVLRMTRGEEVVQ